MPVAIMPKHIFILSISQGCIGPSSLVFVIDLVLNLTRVSSDGPGGPSYVYPT
jgi:hypothetical protein